MNPIIYEHDAHKLAQPTCKYCGLPLRWGKGYGHVDGFQESGVCGSKWFPDYPDHDCEKLDRSTACVEIEKMQAEITDLRQRLSDAEGRAALAERRAVEAERPWKELAEKPHDHRGMKQSLRGLILSACEILEASDKHRKGARFGAGYAYTLRALQRHLCEVWTRRGESGIVAEFGSLYCLDTEEPITEPDEPDDDEGDES